jgi:hypothetical protein
MLYKNALCVYPHQQGAPEKKYCPPIGLEYIATVLEGLVEKVTLVDMRFEPNLDDFIVNNNIDLVCLSVCELGLPTRRNYKHYRSDPFS